MKALPPILVGPILRRTEEQRVCIFVATSAPVKVRAEIYQAVERDGNRMAIGAGEGESVRLGECLYVHLIQAAPKNATFPTDELLAYDIELIGQEGGRRLAELGRGDLGYGPFTRPTFFIQGRAGQLNFMHGSCRLLHGKGEDSLACADETVTQFAADVSKRPAALVLTGDQIYADEVAAPLTPHLRALADELIGPGDDTSIPELPALGTLPVNGRADLMADRAGFTSLEQDNHLASFGEFAAMYLLAWNPDVWPQSFPPAEEVLISTGKLGGLRAKRKYNDEVGDLARARKALPAVRRLLANVPTYMIFDDHDTTDDWNITRTWRDTVRARPCGRRIVANALASYWAFQGWGNDPDRFDSGFKKTISEHLVQRAVAGSEFDEMLWEFDYWGFFVPSDPPIVVLDTRTHRYFDSPEGAARLLGDSAKDRVRELAAEAGHKPHRRLIIVSPVPVFGLELQERRQKALAERLGPYEIDFENWHSNLHGLVDFMCMLVEDLRPSSCLLVSGDIHYGCNAQSSFTVGEEELPIVQVVSSGCKHAGTVSKTALHFLGRVVRREHERLGWHQPPQTGASNRLRRLLMFSRVNSDEWDEDAPVFLSPADARWLHIEKPPDYREYRAYLRPSEQHSSYLMAQNNLGLVMVDEGHVTHCLLTRDKAGTEKHCATMKLG